MSMAVVVVKLAALGDVVMASTMVHAIRQRWPQAHLTWVTGSSCAPLVRRFAGVDRVVAVDTEALLRGGWGARLRALTGVWRALRRDRFDLGFIAHTDVRYDTLLWGVRVRERRAFRDGQCARPGYWMGAEYARLVMDREAPDDIQGEPTLASLAFDPALLAQGETADGAVLLAPGGARNVLRDDPLRRWPLTHWTALAQALHEAGHRVVLVGGPDDRPEHDAIVHAVPGVISLVGKTSLLDLVALIARARVVVTHDSGVLHLALLTKTPAVALFGPTAPEERLPGSARVAVASAAHGLLCAPCYDGRGYAPCTENRCLTGVTVETVRSLVEPWLRG